MVHGTLIITENMKINSTIDINDGGLYIIQGKGTFLNIKIMTFDRNKNDKTFNVSNLQFFSIKDLIIDASNIMSD